ncbi:MAG: hypothetical protein N3D10_00020 [Candidatus Micrarchaeota archaeon]|nr:hypothetical protein [Candidatus Micrarchaeota archaeon]
MKKIKSFAFVPSLNTLALQRIEQLLEYAKKIALSQPEYCKKYVKLAKKIAMRHKIPWGCKRKQLFCKNCNLAYTKKTLRLSFEKNFAKFLCLSCNSVYRIHLSKLLDKYKKLAKKQVL